MIKFRNININYYWLSSLSAIIATAVSIPIMYLVFRAINAENFVELLFRERVLLIIIKSVILVIFVTFFSVVISYLLCHFLIKTNVPFKKFLTVFCCLPIVIPSYVYGMVFVDLLGPKGRIHKILSSSNITDYFPDLYGFWGAAIVLTFLSYPYVFLPLRAAMLRLDNSFEDASRSLGRGRLKTFFYISLPLLFPAIRSGGILVALYTLSDFGAVALLRYETFTWAIMTQYEAGFNRIAAAILSLVLVIIAITLLGFDSIFSGPKNYHSSSSSNRFISIDRLNFKRWFVFFGICIVPFIGVIIPVGGLLFWLFRGLFIGEVFSFNLSLGTIFNSLYVSVLASIFTLIIAMPIAFFAVKHKGKFSILLEKISYIGFGLPAIVVALSLVYFSINFAFPIYQTIFVLIFGYGVLFLPVAVSAIKTTLIQVNQNLEDASRGLGIGYWVTLWRITIPLIMPSVLAGGLLVFLLTLKELPLTMILSPLNFDSLALKVWGYASEAFFAEAALPALILILLSGPASAYLVLRRNDIEESV